MSATEKRPAAAQEHLPAHMTERTDPDRAAEAPHPWERSSAEERYDNAGREWGSEADW